MKERGRKKIDGIAWIKCETNEFVLYGWTCIACTWEKNYEIYQTNKQQQKWNNQATKTCHAKPRTREKQQKIMKEKTASEKA